MKVKLDTDLKTIREVKTWEQTYIEFLVRLSKLIKDNLPMDWSIWVNG